MSTSVVEAVTFRLHAGTSEESFLAAVRASTQFLTTCPGFVERHVGCHKPSGVWLDLVYWESMEFALAAAERFNSAPQTAAFNNLLDKETVSMRHFEVRPSS